MDVKKTAPRLVPCPTCGKQSPWNTENRWRPFCSERCRQIDLGAWANEEYRVPQRDNEPPDPEIG